VGRAVPAPVPDHQLLVAPALRGDLRRQVDRQVGRLRLEEGAPQPHLRLGDVVRRERPLERAEDPLEVGQPRHLPARLADPHPPPDHVALPRAAPEEVRQLLELVEAQPLDREPHSRPDEHEDEGDVVAVGHQDHRAEREERADAVEQEGDLLRRMPEPEQAVVDVVAVGAEDRLPAEEPPDDRQRRVEHREAERDDGDGHGDHGRRLLRAEQPDPGEHEAEEQAPGIAEEDRRRMEVVEEEAERRAGEQDRHRRRAADPVDRRDDEHRRQCEEGGPRGQPVEPVDQVEGVRDRDEPDHGEERPRHRVELDHPDERERELLHAHAGESDGERDADLGEELPPRPDVPQIVEESEGMHGRGAREHDRELSAIDPHAVEPLPGGEHGKRHGDREDDRHAADARDGSRVQLAVPARIVQPRPAGDASHEIGQPERRDQRHPEADHVERDVRWNVREQRPGSLVRASASARGARRTTRRSAAEPIRPGSGARPAVSCRGG
jgi:hypothetical protein